MRIRLGLTAGVLALLAYLGGAVPAWAEVLTRGLLFEVAREGVPPSFLFGTLHSADPRVVALPPPVQVAFDGAQGFVMEAVPDADAVAKSMALMAYADGGSLRQALPADLYTQAVAVMASRGLGEDAVNRLKPWALVMLLSAPPVTGGEVLDLALYRAAQAQGRPTVGLETLEEQVALFDRLDPADQVALLRQTLAIYPELPEVFHRLVAAYVRRDLSSLVQLNEMYNRWGTPELAARFHRVAIDDRNERMAERLAPLLAQGGHFIALGALHLPGPGGLLERLQGQGYRVRPIY